MTLHLLSGNYDAWKTDAPEVYECEDGVDCEGCMYCEDYDEDDRDDYDTTRERDYDCNGWED